MATENAMSKNKQTNKQANEQEQPQIEVHFSMDDLH